MGARGAYGFRIDGADKITYNHFDSYPEALGLDMAKYVKNHTDAELTEAARRLIAIEPDSKATPEQIEKYKQFADASVSSGNLSEWYVLLRGAQRNPEAWHQGLDHFSSDGEFMADSLFCEFAYVVNLDEGTLEYYRGFNKDPKAHGRYAALQRELSSERVNEYFGVRLVESVPLATIRDVDPKSVAKRWDALIRTEDDE